MELFAEGKIDAFLGFPPEPQELRARKIGHVIVNSAMDRPWSQYFCCMLAGNRISSASYPVATKRVLRAILKAADLCADRAGAGRAAAWSMAGSRALRLRAADAERSLHAWRDYDPEDTMRFYALGCTRSGMIKSSPQTIIADGTDWRFLNELKRELKA